MPQYLINRSKLLEEILEEEGWSSACDAGSDEIDFVMWDKCSKPNVPGPQTARLQTLLANEVCLIDNKKHLYTHCKYKIKYMLPETYALIEDAPEEDVGGKCPVWFLKKAFTAGGKDVHCGSLSTLKDLWASQSRHRDWVLQRGVRSCLIDSRKWTLRIYVLFMNQDNGKDNSVWLHEEGLAIIHKLEYSETVDPGVIDSEVHVDHKGCVRYPFSKLPFYRKTFEQVKGTTRDLFLTYQKHLNKAKEPGRYHFFGLDYIINTDMKPVLIEVNQFPNMSINSDRVGRDVKRCVFEDMYSLMIAPAVFGIPRQKGGFVKIV